MQENEEKLGVIPSQQSSNFSLSPDMRLLYQQHLPEKRSRRMMNVALQETYFSK
jgi:hypothetical protein